MDPHIVNVNELPDIEGMIERPGSGAVAGTDAKWTHYLGLPDDNPLNPQKAPFVYHIRRPAGDVRTLSPVTSSTLSRLLSRIRPSASATQTGSRPFPERWTIGTLPHASATRAATRTGSWS